MKIVVDTNIVFSALLSSSSRIGQVLVYSPSGCFSFYSCLYLRFEILKHFDKLQKYTKLNNAELTEFIHKIERRITFIDDQLLPVEFLENAEKLTEGIDSDDTPFIAAAEYLNAFLWTGDKVLASGLQAKNYRNLKTTADMVKMLQDYEGKRK